MALAGFMAAALVGWLCVRVNLERGCTTQDTPYLQLCPAIAPGSAADIANLRARIAANPGDANAYVRLALATRTPQTALAASQAAPNEPSVQMLHAIAALEREDWPRAVGPLVQLVEYRETPQAAQVLARLVAGGQGALLAPHVKPGSRWLPRVLAQMPQGQASFSSALPLIVQALRAGILEPESIRSYMRQFKAAGAWADAYSLWLALQGRTLPILFNAGFDDAFQQGGFDWEIPASGPPSRVGAIVERKGAESRGAVLDVRFTGRAITLPMARQHLFLGEGRWRLKGEYAARQLRAEEGLAWTVRCTASSTQAGRSPPLGDTSGAWRAFEFEFTVRPDCGLAAVLQLETFVPTEAALGARGRVAFDAFSLEKLPF
jgi:hypothetical protein